MLTLRCLTPFRIIFVFLLSSFTFSSMSFVVATCDVERVFLNRTDDF